jgi:hypothetical protein
MQNAEWVALFSKMPQAIHAKLVLVLQNRSDIAIDTIFRLEPSFIVLRGRLGGTTETGLLFMVPYDQITSFYINREVKEEEINTIFEAAAHVPPALKASSHQAAAKPAFNGAVPAAAVGPRPSVHGIVTAPAPKLGEPPATTARNNLLERLRAARNAAMPPSSRH